MTHQDSAKPAGAFSAPAATSLRVPSKKRTSESRSKPGDLACVGARSVVIEDASELPDQYALIVAGNCLAPKLPDGTAAAFSKTEAPKPSDIVVLWARPEIIPAGWVQASVKRLGLAIPGFVTFPWRDHPDSEVLPVIVAEMDNPPRRFAIRCSDLLAIHKFIGVAEQIEPYVARLPAKRRRARNG